MVKNSLKMKPRIYLSIACERGQMREDSRTTEQVCGVTTRAHEQVNRFLCTRIHAVLEDNGVAMGQNCKKSTLGIR